MLTACQSREAVEPEVVEVVVTQMVDGEEVEVVVTQMLRLKSSLTPPNATLMHQPKKLRST